MCVGVNAYFYTYDYGNVFVCVSVLVYTVHVLPLK